MGYSRRDIVKHALLGAVSMALGPQLRTMVEIEPESLLITRPIPSTGERLPVIGLGGNAYGVKSARELAERRAVLQNLPLLGGRVVDTAQGYGRSEAVIGELVEGLGNREQLFLASKMAMGGNAGSPSDVLEASFKALRVQHIDLMQIHNLFRYKDFMPVLRRAKAEGRIRYIGVSASEIQYPLLLRVMREQPLDFVQVNYSLGMRELTAPVFDEAVKRGIAVMVSEPFGGRQRAGALFGRLAKHRLPEWAAEIDVHSWAQFMLKYVASHSAVTVVIPGTTNIRHLQDNIGAARGRLPDAETRVRMERLWDSLSMLDHAAG